MRVPRIYQAATLTSNAEIALDDEATTHVARVLRLPLGAKIILFNGLGGEYPAVLSQVDRKVVKARILEFLPREVESSLNLHLGQAISGRDKMRFSLQKCVELGVTQITPLITEHCAQHVVKQFSDQKFLHWQEILIAACEQSGRNRVPELHPPMGINDWFEQLKNQDAIRIILDPRAPSTLHTVLKSVSKPVTQTVYALIGSEGGFSELEIKLATRAHFQAVSLGPRVLRTETAGVTCLSILQYALGDLG
jgi:16S rRNA (uracil1498-N3)-methyltransferase